MHSNVKVAKLSGKEIRKGKKCSTLGIPAGATVIGRHGGACRFNIDFVHELRYETVQADSNMYFLLLNTDRFCEPYPQITLLPACFDLDEKVRFINTCDACSMAAKAEKPSVSAPVSSRSKNKPVITFHSTHLDGTSFRLVLSRAGAVVLC